MPDTTTSLQDFFTRYPLQSFDKRQIIAQAEEPMPGVFYLVEGRVSQYDITPSGNEVVVNVFKPGSFFPMSWAINATPNHYFFEASTKVSAHVAPATEAVQFLKDNPTVTFDLLARVYQGVDGVLRRMAHLMGGDAKSRLLFELLNATYRFGETQNDGTFFVALTESDLARHSGLARETVSRCMRELKATGTVTVTHSGILVKSTDELETMLGSAL